MREPIFHRDEPIFPRGALGRFVYLVFMMALGWAVFHSFLPPLKMAPLVPPPATPAGR